MSSERQQRIEQLFQEAADLPQDRRGSFLDSAGLAPGERAEIDDHLRLIAEVASGPRPFLATPLVPATPLVRAARAAFRALDAPLDGAESETRIGPYQGRQQGAGGFGVAHLVEAETQIGPYKVVRELGAGGFGVVYLAEQEQPIRRRVALKLIKLGMDTRAIVARFEAERQLLAVVDHPHIAKVLEAGATERGRPYFVMEYVDGEPITTCATRHALDEHGRLRLFLQVCDAVQHAHQKGVIHRDLKPSNVLVEQIDGAPFVKVIDFGIARAMAGPGAQALTQEGLLLGTPAYMSPEQATQSGDELDTRTDVFSLGVLLYELLTGVLPFVAANQTSPTPGEILRAVREVDPPPPSSRARVARDLDWIVLKALEKERERRYASVSELASDVRRYLALEPVEASPPSATYRWRKMMRRHRVAFASGALIVLALVVGLVLATWGLVAKGRALEQAQRSEKRALSVLELFLQTLGTADRAKYAGKTFTVREALDLASQNIGRFAGDADTETAVRMALGSVYHGIGELPAAEEHLRRAFALRRDTLGADDPDTIAAEARLGSLFLDLANHDSEALLSDALARYRRAGEAHTIAAVWCQYQLALARNDRTLVRDSLQQMASLVDRDDEHLATMTSSLAKMLYEQGKLVEAEQLSRDALRRFLALQDGRNGGVVTERRRLAIILSTVGNNQEAMSELREALRVGDELYGTKHHERAITLAALANVLLCDGRVDEAAAPVEEAVSLSREVLGEQHPIYGRALYYKGVVLQAQDPAAAERLLRTAVAIDAASLGDRHRETVQDRATLATTLAQQGRQSEAIEIMKEVVPIAHEVLGTTPEWVDCIECVATWLEQTGRFPEAEELLLDAFASLPSDDESQPCRRLLVQRIVQLYERWHSRDPDAVSEETLAEWRDRLAGS